jgi:4-hydroxy-3-polyprenylbenzoate decarboxylase
LLRRRADVVLKERWKLVVVPRETPLSTIHLKNMLELSRAGAVIMPAAPGFYTHPQSISDMVAIMTGKILDAFDIDHDLSERWGENGKVGAR